MCSLKSDPVLLSEKKPSISVEINGWTKYNFQKNFTCYSYIEKCVKDLFATINEVISKMVKLIQIAFEFVDI